MWPYDNPEFASLFDHVGVDRTWELYTARLFDDIEKLPGHVVGHFYRPAGFGHWPDQAKLEAYEDRLLELAHARGMAVEINSRGIYRADDDVQRAKYIEANKRLMRKAKAKGVGIAIGSDAHSPKDQGGSFDVVLQMLDDCDINEVVFPVGGRLARVVLRATREHLEAARAALARAGPARQQHQRPLAGRTRSSRGARTPPSAHRAKPRPRATSVPRNAPAAPSARPSARPTVEKPKSSSKRTAESAASSAKSKDRKESPEPPAKAPPPKKAAETVKKAPAKPAAVPKKAPAKKAAPVKKAPPAKTTATKAVPAKAAPVKKVAAAKKAAVTAKKAAPVKKAAAPAKKPAPAKTVAKKAPAKKAAPVKATAKKAAPVKKAVAKKSPPAKSAAVKKSVKPVAKSSKGTSKKKTTKRR